MQARQLFRYKAQQGDVICEMVIWGAAVIAAGTAARPEVQAVLRPIA
jgi:hypothetical protein